jgi:hypothetical protein
VQPKGAMTVPASADRLPAMARDVAVSSWFACASAEDSVACWGMNAFGELGNGSLVASERPVRVALDYATP